MNDTIESSTTSRIGPVLALSYLYLPFLLFDLGWIRPMWSIPIAAISFVGFVLACRRMPSLWIPALSWKIVAKAFSCAILLGLWVWSSGIGGYVWGEVDHLARNTVFKMLVKRPWPLYSMGTIGLTNDVEHSILSYYIGFFLPPAIVGKLTSLRIGFFALWCWAFLGVCLTYYLLCAKIRKLTIWPVLVLIFFSGADSIGVIIRGLHNPGVIPFWSPTSNFEQWSAYNYSCQTTQLYWVYNQAIPAWIATALLLCGISPSCMLFAASVLMISSTFSFVAICALSGAFAWSSLCQPKRHETVFGKAVRWLEKFISIPNMIGVIIVGVPSFLYLSANSAGSKFNIGFHWTYPLFILFEVIAIMLPLFAFMRKDPMYWFVLFSLVVIPFGRVGFAHDFYSRTSIPLLFIVLVWTVERLSQAIKEKFKFRVACFLIVVVLGAATPIHEMSRTYVNTQSIPDIANYWRTHNAPESVIMQFHNPYVFTAPVEGNAFCIILAKQPVPRSSK